LSHIPFSSPTIFSIFSSIISFCMYLPLFASPYLSLHCS
jgi:hypothetical protein